MTGRRTLALVVVAALSGCTVASAQEKTFERTVGLDAGGTLTVAVDRGSIDLTSWDRPSLEVRARIEPPTGVSADYARRAVEATRIEVTGSGNAVDVRADYSAVPYASFFGRRIPRVHYEIMAPRRLNLDLDVDRSDAVVHGFDGRLDLDLDRSQLDAQGLAGEVSLRLDRSQIGAEDLSGTVSLRVDRGPRVEVSGLRGTLDLDLDRTRATLRDVRLAGDSRVRVDRGGVDVEWVGDQALTIDGDLDRSSISSDLPMSVNRRGTDFHGTLNGGGPTLRVDADRSDLSFRAR